MNFNGLQKLKESMLHLKAIMQCRNLTFIDLQGEKLAFGILIFKACSCHDLQRESNKTVVVTVCFHSESNSIFYEK